MPTPVTVAKIEKKSVANIFLSLKFIPIFQGPGFSIIIQLDALQHYLPSFCSLGSAFRVQRFRDLKNG